MPRQYKIEIKKADGNSLEFWMHDDGTIEISSYHQTKISVMQALFSHAGNMRELMENNSITKVEMLQI